MWWFHRTFRERAPGGLGRRSVRGFRSKDRPIGRKKGNARNDSGPHLLAIGLIAFGEIAPKADGEPNYYLAAQQAVLRCERMDDLPGAFATLIAKEAQERENKESRERGVTIRERHRASVEADKALLARVRLIHRVLTAEHKRGLARHIDWLRSTPAALAEVRPLLANVIEAEHSKL